MKFYKFLLKKSSSFNITWQKKTQSIEDVA